jgi:nitronate monooxygenase
MIGFNIGNLHIKVPIIQGGMGVGISLSGLASAVANQGGVGVISAVGIGFSKHNCKSKLREANLDGFRNEIRKARKKSKGIIGVNIMYAISDFDELLKVALEEMIDIVFIGAGLPLRKPNSISLEFLKKSNTKFVPKISSAKAAKLIFQYWSDKHSRIPDAVVVEGPLSGGHQGFKKCDLNDTTIKLSDIVKQTINILKPFEEKYNVKVPVIAAGGIYTGHDMHEIMQTGASAVKMGSRFVTTHECDASIKFKEYYLNCNKDDITIIDSPVGLPGRVINNSFTNKIKNGEAQPIFCPWKCLKTCNYKTVGFCIAKALINAAEGNIENGIVFAGTKAHLADKIISVKETFQKIKTEYAAQLLKFLR